MGLPADCSKFVLAFFNALLLLLGLAPLVFGIIALVSDEVLGTLLEQIPGTEKVTEIVNPQELIRNSAIVLIIFGGVLVTVGFLGCYGACCRLKLLLVVYMILMAVLIVAEIAIVVVAFAYPDTFNSTAKSVMLKSLEDKRLQDINGSLTNTENMDAVSLAWHTMQYELNCCGANNLSDYMNDQLQWDKRVQTALAPVTCCKHTQTKFPPKSFDDMSAPCITPGNIAVEYVQEGCFYTLINWIVKSSVVIGILAGIGALEIILVIMSVILLCNISSKSTSEKYRK